MLFECLLIKILDYVGTHIWMLVIGWKEQKLRFVVGLN